jgi:PAS domain S-box-containing protein
MKKKSQKPGGLTDFLEEQDIVSLMRFNLVFFVAIALVGIIGFAVVGDAGWAHFARNGLLLLAGSLFILFLLKQGRILLAAYSSLGIYGLIFAYSAWTGAGVQGTVYSLFFLLVVGTALLIGRRAGYITALIAIALGLALLLAGRAGLLVNRDRPSVDFVTWITLSASFLIAAHIAGLVIRQAERALEKARREVGEGERRFRKVFENSPVAIVLTTLKEGRTIDANEAYWNLSGHDPKTSIGKTTIELRAGYDADRRQEFVNSLAEKGSIRDPNYVFVDDSNRMRYTMAFFELIDLEGQEAILSMFYDMTEQIEARNALERSEEQVRGLLNAIPETIFELGRDGTILQYVPSHEASAHNVSGDIVGKTIDRVLPAHVAGQIIFAVERALESGQLHIIEYRLPQDGSEMDFETRVTVSGKDAVLLMARDVSLHKRLEVERESMIEELEKRNAESESLRETTVIVTSTLDVSEAVQRILKQLKRVISYDSASVWLYTGTTTHLVGGDGIPDMPEEGKHYAVSETEPDYPLWIENLPYILLDDVQENYPQFRNPPINYIHGWLGVPLKVRGKLIGIISLDSREAGRFTHDDARLAVNYANQVSIAVENARLFSDLQNELYERQKLIDELDSKNSELERFTYAVSHDLKSPLITIRGFVGFLREDIAAGNASRMQADLRQMAGAMDVMQQRLDDLLELSRAGRLTDKPEVIRFNDLIAEALGLVHGRISQRGIVVHVEENLPAIIADRRRLLEVLQNLLDNAAKFLRDEPTPRIDIGQRGEADGKPVFFVRDNGMGIPPEHREKIFGIFNKLDPKAEGTGIGLSLVKRIIEAHEGRIWVESEAGMGSTFYFTLPRG